MSCGRRREHPRTNIGGEGFAGFWDDAVRNNSSLQAALTRRSFDEVVVIIGEFVIGAYFDIANILPRD